MSWRPLLLGAIAFGILARAVGMYAIPLVDPSEGRYAASASEILRTGDWLVPPVFVKGEPVPYLGKPPLELWLSATAMRLGGVHPFWSRVPCFLALLLMLGFMYKVLRRYEGEEFALMATGLCAATPGFLIFAGIGMPDTMLTACVAACYCAYYAFLQEPDHALKKRWSLLVFVFAGLGFMSKGPVALIFIGLPALAWTIHWRRWDTLKQHAWLLGIPLFLLITVPWFVLCERANPGFIQYFFINENLLRFIQPEFGDKYGQGHQQYFGAALAFAIALSLPWSLWGIVLAASKKTRPAARELWKSPALSFFLYIVATNVLFWCFCRNYLPTYLLPVIPALSIVLAALFRATSQSWMRVSQIAAASVAVVSIASIVVVTLISDFSSLTVGKMALAEAARVGAPPKICWIRKIPNSAFFYFRDELVVPPHAEELEIALPWFLANSQYTLVSQAKHLRGLPQEFQDRIEILANDGRWVIFRIKAPA